MSFRKEEYDFGFDLFIDRFFFWTTGFGFGFGFDWRIGGLSCAGEETEQLGIVSSRGKLHIEDEFFQITLPKFQPLNYYYGLCVKCHYYESS